MRKKYIKIRICKCVIIPIRTAGMLVSDGSPIRHAGLRWDMSVSDEACRGRQ